MRTLDYCTGTPLCLSLSLYLHVKLKYLFLWCGFISIFARFRPIFAVSVYLGVRYTFHIDFDMPDLSGDLYRRDLQIIEQAPPVEFG
jgi:hypothetical protein